MRMLGWQSRRTSTGIVWSAPDADKRGTYPTQAEQMQARKALS